MTENNRPVYLDHAATTPVDPRVAELVMHYMINEFGNAGSRTHIYGSEALKAVAKAREQVAAVVETDPSGVIFTSGATESNNLAILGLTDYGRKLGRRHIVSTMIEHKAVLEPLEEMERRGFDVTLIRPDSQGVTPAEAVLDAVRDDTLLVSVMHVNNEIGTIQPLAAIADGLEGHPSFFHTDAAQGYAKDLYPLKHSRIDMISISGHKIGATKGIGALIMRRRRYKFPPLQPLMFGGGQERGISPGTAAVPQIAGLGLAAEIALKEHATTQIKVLQFRKDLHDAFKGLICTYHGNPEHCVAGTASISFSELDSEVVMLALKPHVAISNGSACTSSEYKPSHVLLAMGLDISQAQCATRWSWGPKTGFPNWNAIRQALQLAGCDSTEQEYEQDR